jgi:molecular chaperone GrpE
MSEFEEVRNKDKKNVNLESFKNTFATDTKKTFTNKVNNDVNDNEKSNTNETDEVSEENLESDSDKGDGLKSLEIENKKIKDTLLRTLAELDNVRRIASEEKEKITKYAISKFAEDLLNVMDNFYMAFDNVDETKVDKNFFDGIKLTHNELKKIFEKNGLNRIYPLGENFNPDLHNAIQQVESDYDEGVVAIVMQAGYTLNGRTLRPSLVAVSKGK